jgi:required for meiotic nuclear division protein 1
MMHGKIHLTMIITDFNMIIKAIKILTKTKFKDLIKSISYKPIYQSNYEIAYQLDVESFLIVYSFGVYVLFNINQKDILNDLSEKFNSKNAKEDFYNIEIKKKGSIKVDHNQVIIPKLELKYIRIVALVLAQSVMLDMVEEETEKILEASIEYSKALELQGSYQVNKKKLFKFIGFVLTTKQSILNNLYIYDSPNEAWNNPKLENMFFKLKDLFDIQQRYESIKESLTAIQENIAVITNWIQFKKSSMLELWIIILFVVDILMTIGSYLFGYLFGS